LAGLASWHQYYPVPCVRHLYWAAIPMFGVFALACEHLWRSSGRKVQCRIAAGALFVMAALPIGVRLYGAAMLLDHFGTFRSIDLPGVRHMRLANAEYEALNDLKSAYEALPPHLRARGVFNYTPDAVLSAAFPETKFRHPMFVNWKDDVYRDYPARAMDHILTVRPAVVSSEELDFLENAGYRRRDCGELYGRLYGRRYFFYSPCD